MIIKNDAELKQYQQLARISTNILEQLRRAVKIGVTPLVIDALADKLSKKYKVKPNFKGVGPKNNQYQHATCIAVNDTVVHGIPDDRPFEDGDVVKVDFGIEKDGLQTDHCFTVGVGNLSAADEHLIKTAKKAIQTAAKKAIVGSRVGDLGFIIQSIANQNGCTVAKEFVGHGIGHTMHDEPQIPAYGNKGKGQELKKGMVLCVEAQILAGEDDIYFADDGWTVKTCDGSKAAMFEYMVVVQADKPIFLTPTLNWPIRV